MLLRSLLLLLPVALFTAPCSQNSKEEELLSEARTTHRDQIAEKCLEVCIKKYPKSFGCWFHRGIRAQKWERHELAESYFKKAAILNPNSSQALHMIGGTLLLQGPSRASEAQSHLLKAESLNPASGAVVSDLALATYYLGRVDDALEIWRRCIALEPNNEASHLYNMIGVYQERGRLRTARKLLRRMLDLAPSSAEAHESLAVVQAQ